MPQVVFPHMAGVDATAVNSGHDGDNPEQMDTKQNATAASPNSTLDSPDAGATEPSVEQLPVPIPEGLTSLHIVGLGACGMDMLASVAEFPAPDDKIRTTEVSFLGGGNCANTLTAARRLGISCSLIAKVGDDANGSAVLSELARDGVDTTNMIVRKGMNTPFTYVIVSQACSSRTCIHTPASEDVRAEDLNDLNAVLSSASLLALDGRHTLAAVKLARKANELGIPVLLDVERNRPHLEELLPCADYIVTNSKYPMIFSPEASGPIDAMVRLLRAGRARFIITTAGSSGSTLLAREKDLPIGRPDPDLSISRRVEIPSGHDDIGPCAIVECPAWTPAKVVDTTGAGDAFIGKCFIGSPDVKCIVRKRGLTATDAHLSLHYLPGSYSRPSLLSPTS